jgi:hypothetical protein
MHASWKSGKLPKQKPGFADDYAMDNFVEDISIALTKAIRIS